MASDPSRLADQLRSLPLFSGLTQDDLEELMPGVTELTIARGDILFRRGQPCTGFHVVIEGQIKLFLASPAGDEKVVRLIGPGDSFGEALMFLGKPYVVSSQALADTRLLHVSAATVMGKLERSPEFARLMLASLSQRLHSLMSDVEAYSLRSGAQRVASYFLHEADGRSAFRLETAKAVIASRLNLTPEHFSRILRDLEDRGLIRMSGREIDIPDPSALERFQA